MMYLLVSFVYVGCFLMVSLPPLCSGGFGKVAPRAPNAKSADSLTNSEDILYHCLRTQQCDCKQYYRFETCWEKLPERIRRFGIDLINSCGMDERVDYGSMQAWTEILCPVSHNITKACYDKKYKIIMEELIEASSGKKGPKEAQEVEEARRCGEPTLAFCSEYPKQCAD